MGITKYQQENTNLTKYVYQCGRNVDGSLYSFYNNSKDAADSNGRVSVVYAHHNESHRNECEAIPEHTGKTTDLVHCMDKSYLASMIHNVLSLLNHLMKISF